ncbi:hypothetical protein HYFRA_00002055 [Hymenoscyphus fraxineus]|uniref:Uncharacterized protein n=1 Tax=Hymenoscyphus fraxineus TaxID=746836 RepID=A0A9N9KLL6_9HELO|nr:hypothetical protein HYFRA_00002055 [Hymenoscyphus fraxineus]
MANFKFLSVFLSVSLAFGAEIQSTSARFRNSTVPAITGAPSAASGCCFVVQDTVSQIYWKKYVTITLYSIVNLTSITTYVTPYPTTTFSSVTTNVYTTNASFSYSKDVAKNPIALYYNEAGSVSQSWKSLNGSQIVTAGVTVNSPSAFNVYPTLKVINVPAVKDEKGNLVCATTSSLPNLYTGFSESYTSIPTKTISDTKTLTATLYTTSGSGLLSAIKTATLTTTVAFNTNYKVSVSTGGAFTSLYDAPTFTANSNAEEYFSTGKSNQISATVLSLATPYIHFPTRGHPSVQTLSKWFPPCEQLSGAENYGYPAQQAVDFAASEFPQLVSCIPAGPRVLKRDTCTHASPETQNAGGDLTSSTVITVTPTATSSDSPILSSVLEAPALKTDAPSPSIRTAPHTSTLQPPINIPSSVNETPSLNKPAPTQSHPADGSEMPVVPEDIRPTIRPTQSQLAAQTQQQDQNQNPISSQNASPGQGPIPNQELTLSQGSQTQTPQSATTASADKTLEGLIASLVGLSPVSIPVGTVNAQPIASPEGSKMPLMPDLSPHLPTTVTTETPNFILGVSGGVKTVPLPTSVSSTGLETLGSNAVNLASVDGEPSANFILSGARTISIPSHAPNPTTTFSGVPNVIIGMTDQTRDIFLTVPLPSESSGDTRVVDVPGDSKHSTYLVHTRATTHPIPSQSPYSTTFISGTPNIVVGSPDQTMSFTLTAPLPSGFQGSTTILSASGNQRASTYLVLTGATTIPITGIQASISHVTKSTSPAVASLPTSALSSSLTSANSSNGTGSPQSSTFAQVSSSTSSLSKRPASVVMSGLVASLLVLF